MRSRANPNYTTTQHFATLDLWVLFLLLPDFCWTGPTQIEPRVYEAMSKPMVGYLDPFFFQVNEEVRTGLQQVFGTKNEFTLAISGILALFGS